MKAIHTGLGILLSVCAFLSSLSAHLRDIQRIRRSRVSLTITTEIIIKILVELLSTLALATKQLQQGELSESALAEISNYLTVRRRSACQEEAPRGEGRRRGTSEVGSAH